MSTIYTSMPELVEELGVPYHRLYWAVLTGKVSPQRSGRSRLFSQRDVEILKNHFHAREEKGEAC